MLEVARRHSLVDPDRLIVTGISQGGGITLAAAGLASMAGVSFGGLPTYRSCATFGRATEITDQHPYADRRGLAAPRGRRVPHPRIP
jgi:cephalosporin-C deacetylase